MSFSLWGAKTEAFFDFIRGDVHWRYTNQRRLTDFGGYTWSPAKGIKRSSIKDSAERRQAKITVTMPSDLAVLSNFRPYMPREEVQLIITVRDRGTAESEIEWTGRVLTSKFGGATATLNCEPSITKGERAGISLCWQRGCGLAQYSQGRGMCNLVKAAWEVPVAAMTQVDAITFTATEFTTVAGGLLAGGFIEYVRAGDGVIEQRSIVTHDTATGTITTDYGLYDPPAGLACSAYPYCRQNVEICQTTFNNLPNNQGEIFMPGKSPYNGERRS